MGSRNRFTKRTKKAAPKALEYTTSAGRGKNRTSTKSKTIPADKRPADMKKGVTYGDAGRPYKGPGGNPNGSGQGQAQQAPRAPKLPPKPKPSPSPAPTRAKAKPTPATSSNAQSLRQSRSPDKPAKKPRTWLADNYKPGGPPKAKESLQIKPKKKKLTNKQRKQGGFH